MWLLNWFRKPKVIVPPKEQESHGEAWYRDYKAWRMKQVCQHCGKKQGEPGCSHDGWWITETDCGCSPGKPSVRARDAYLDKVGFKYGDRPY